MKAYYCEFAGHWPVGAVLVVLADNKKEALQRALKLIERDEPDLLEDNDYLTENHMVEITEDKILLNGDY